MSDEELKALVEKEEQERYDELIHCLFSPTEHCALVGTSRCMESILRLIEEGYIKPDILLQAIGRKMCDLYRNSNNKNYQL